MTKLAELKEPIARGIEKGILINKSLNVLDDIPMGVFLADEIIDIIQPHWDELQAKIDKLVEALEEIAESEGLTLLAPDDAPTDHERAYEMGCNRGFDQNAQIAKQALEGLNNEIN